MSRRRRVFPDDASMGLTPHSAAKDASLGSRSGLSPGGDEQGGGAVWANAMGLQ